MKNTLQNLRLVTLLWVYFCLYDTSCFVFIISKIKFEADKLLLTHKIYSFSCYLNPNRIYEA